MRREFVLVLAAALFTPVSVEGSWTNPPPFNPEQEGGRVLEWDFYSPDNWRNPATLYGPEWDGPGWECDEVIVDGDLQHFFEDPTGSGRSGLLGIDNREGDGTTKTGSIRFHINNFDNENPWKYFWDEAEYYGTFMFGVSWPTDCDGDWEFKNVQDLGDGWTRDNADGWIQPNPEWEEFVWNFSVEDGDMMFLDNFRVATLCIPEPGTLVMFGLCALAVIRRR